ncbi:3-deoxy-D-manno-octulosonic-acid transferase [Desulfocapsa sulfexigens DSM 10523]|uniref:3-deoxy-D-manno-octulosonic acid transferase n=1 Tax=Desulfocapsa sulfexigens (strain DSM 10523 / SB164P1) TaxID=1167006 RepID=M1P8M2_DESSD|nr:3-deoxy-D-manno-octulosonic acid transferase [Desulfocapsa sulfexigens]AGF79833.1 3-deoxy-D-manno-octulosonic-acid transferase [Desulfocapsa sulfexigens DSM 10523]
MIILYTLLQLLLLPFVFLPLMAVILLVPKYRMRTLQRFGLGLKAAKQEKKRKTIWIHALSVGEVTSALPLISGLRREMPDVELVFSAATRSGSGVAEKLLHDKVDRFIPFPFDFLPIVNRFIRVVQPDLFILIETDFWPAILSSLKQQGIPSLLVNGRISKKSMNSYNRFPFFFIPLFSSFRTLSMQTENDKDNLIALGVDHRQIETLGNLKYDTALYSSSSRKQNISFSLPPYDFLVVAGSTHEGEEEILLQSFKTFKEKYPQSYMVIAPRHTTRGKEIQSLAAALELQANRRSQINAGGRDILILDTIGELNTIYSHADIAFVGGSLVAKGGHNPIEPSIFAVPVLFGPHMEDFSEVSEQLLQAGGAFTVSDHLELTTILCKLCDDSRLLRETGKAAQSFVKSQQGVIKRHLNLIQKML